MYNTTPHQVVKQHYYTFITITMGKDDCRESFRPRLGDWRDPMVLHYKGVEGGHRCLETKLTTLTGSLVETIEGIRMMVYKVRAVREV